MVAVFYANTAGSSIALHVYFHFATFLLNIQPGILCPSSTAQLLSSLISWLLVPRLAQTLIQLPCAECVGGVIAGIIAGPLYGVGSPFLKKFLPWIHETEIVKEDGKVVDMAHPEHKHGGDHHHQHRNEIYDAPGTDAPLYPAGPAHANQNGHHGLSTIV